MQSLVSSPSTSDAYRCYRMTVRGPSVTRGCHLRVASLACEAVHTRPGRPGILVSRNTPGPSVCAVTVTLRVASRRLSWGARLPVGGLGALRADQRACQRARPGLGAQSCVELECDGQGANSTCQLEVQVASLRLRAGSPTWACPPPTLTITAQPPAGLNRRAC
jgi:hypothetical protein